MLGKVVVDVLQIRSEEIECARVVVLDRLRYVDDP
jgi:hypothetical protein